MWRAPQSRARLSLRQPEPKFRGESGQQQDLAVPNPSLALQDICPNAGNPIRLTPSTIQLLEQGELGRVRAEFLDDDGARWSLGPLSGRDKIIDLEESRPDPQEGVISTLLIKPLDEMRRALVRIQEQRNLQGRLLVKAKPLDQKATFEQTSRWLSLVGVEPSLEWAPGPSVVQLNGLSFLEVREGTSVEGIARVVDSNQGEVWGFLDQPTVKFQGFGRQVRGLSVTTQNRGDTEATVRVTADPNYVAQNNPGVLFPPLFHPSIGVKAQRVLGRNTVFTRATGELLILITKAKKQS